MSVEIPLDQAATGQGPTRTERSSSVSHRENISFGLNLRQKLLLLGTVATALVISFACGDEDAPTATSTPLTLMAEAQALACDTVVQDEPAVDGEIPNKLALRLEDQHIDPAVGTFMRENDLCVNPPLFESDFTAEMPWLDIAVGDDAPSDLVLLGSQLDALPGVDLVETVGEFRFN